MNSRRTTRASSNATNSSSSSAGTRPRNAYRSRVPSGGDSVVISSIVSTRDSSIE